MLQSTQEIVTVSVPTTATNVDPHTGETLSGGAARAYSVPVVWVTAPRRELRYDANSGAVHGTLQAGEAQLLYEPGNVPEEDATWSDWIKPDVIVTRGGLTWTPYAIAEDQRHSRVVVYLRLREGGQ